MVFMYYRPSITNVHRPIYEMLHKCISVVITPTSFSLELVLRLQVKNFYICFS